MRKRNITLLAISSICLVLCAFGGLSYGFLKDYIQGDGATLAEVDDDRTPSAEQVLAGKEALERWKATPKEKRVPLAKSIVFGKVLLKLPKATIIKALGDPTPANCDIESHLHYTMVESDKQDVDLIVDLQNNEVDEAIVKEFRW